MFEIIIIVVVAIVVFRVLSGIEKDIKAIAKKQKKQYTCPSCGQSCTKEEYESGYCLDCDQEEMELF